MPSSYDVVIVGGGQAGAACAEAIRDAGSDLSIAIFMNEPHAPYVRPPLTKGFLRGEKTEADTLVEPEPWYEQHDVDLYQSTVVRRIDRDTAQVELGDGTRIGYANLVLATGAEPRVPDWPGEGDHSDRVFTIRTLEDSERVRELLTPGARWLIVGGGYIGVETAASALMEGCDVDLVMQEPVLWRQFYGDRVGGWFQRQLRDHGARIHAADEVVQLGVVDGVGLRAATKGGSEISADYVLAGIGVTPRLGLAREAGLDVDRGVTCDRFLRTSDPAIYAVGDICEYDSVVHDGPMRIEHWDVARKQGTFVGRRLAGVVADSEPYAEVPYFFSELGDWARMRYVGPGMGDVVVRGSLDDGAGFSAAYLQDGRLVALLAVDHDDDLDAARDLLAEHPRMNVERLADDSVPLADAVLA